MKTSIIFFVLITTITSSCKENSAVEPSINGFTAKKNASEIKGQVEIYSMTKNDTLSLFFKSNMPNDEVLVVKIPFHGIGKYTISGNQSYYYSTVGGDVFMSEYNHLTSDAGQFEVLKYDIATKTITGKFTISLNKKWSRLETNATVLNFTGGFFQGKINDYLAAL